MTQAIYEGVVTICSYICHQDPQRSFFLWGTQFPLCARCTGLYGFLVVGGVFALTIFKKTIFHHRVIFLFIALSVSSGIEAMLESWFFQTNNMIRFISGSISGFFLGLTILHLIFVRKDPSS
jgi:uncharacterized membrane protein